MQKQKMLYGGIILIIVAFAGLYFGYSLRGTATEGEGPSEKWLWTSFVFQLLAGICFIWQHITQSQNMRKSENE